MVTPTTMVQLYVTAVMKVTPWLEGSTPGPVEGTEGGQVQLRYVSVRQIYKTIYIFSNKKYRWKWYS